MTSFALLERSLLADDLDALGPDAPTLCAGWTTADLAAHVVVRERRPDTGLGLLLPRLAGYTDAVREHTKRRYRYPDLVALVRQRPWWSPISNPAIDEAANTVEFFVHHEDARRGAGTAEPRSLPAEQERVLWRRLGPLARLILRRSTASVRLVAPGFGTHTAGTSTGPVVTITGSPGELLLFVHGRQGAARVGIEGPEPEVAALRRARLGI